MYTYIYICIYIYIYGFHRHSPLRDLTCRRVFGSDLSRVGAGSELTQGLGFGGLGFRV